MVYGNNCCYCYCYCYCCCCCCILRSKHDAFIPHTTAVLATGQPPVKYISLPCVYGCLLRPISPRARLLSAAYRFPLLTNTRRLRRRHPHRGCRHHHCYCRRRCHRATAAATATGQALVKPWSQFMAQIPLCGCLRGFIALHEAYLDLVLER